MRQRPPKSDVEITRDDVILTDELIKRTLKRLMYKRRSQEEIDEILVDEFKKTK